MSEDLLTIETMRKENDIPTPLIYLADEFRDGKLLIPDYQRDYVWDDNKLKGWIKTVITGKAIGVIVTYQLENDPRLFLADGLQRLTATNKFLDNPERYNFNCGKDQARVYCRSFSITAQHRIYINHREAMEAFKALNRGTALKAGEFHKGELTLTEIGRDIYNKLPAIIDRYETRFLSRGSKVYKDPKFIRDCLSLFLQYLSGTEQTSFWRTSSNKISNGVSVEQKMQEYLSENNYTLDDMMDIYNRFEEFTASHYTAIDHVLKEINMVGKPMSVTASRYLYHLNIWRKNTGRPAALYIKFVTNLLMATRLYPTINSHFDIYDQETEKVYRVRMSIDEFRQLDIVGVIIKVPEFYEYKRKANSKTQPGYHRSHLQPVSFFGEGETIIEPSMINMIRGASSIP